MSTAPNTAFLFTGIHCSQWDGCSLCVPIDWSCGPNLSHSLHYGAVQSLTLEGHFNFPSVTQLADSPFQNCHSVLTCLREQSQNGCIELVFSPKPLPPISSLERCSSLLRKEVLDTLPSLGKIEDAGVGLHRNKHFRESHPFRDVSP